MSAEPRETWYAWQDGSGYWRPRMLTGSGSSVERAVESQEDAEYWAEVLNRHDSTVYLLGCSLQRSADDVKSLSAQVDALTKERDGLKAALEFYGDERRYDGPNQTMSTLEKDPHTPLFQPYLQDVTRDRGTIARAALQGVRT